MKQKSSYRIKLVLIVIVAAILFGSGHAKADFIFGEPINLGLPVNSENSESGPTISADGLELYFNCYRAVQGFDSINLWVVKRQTQDDDWGEPVPLGPEVNSIYEEAWSKISPDGLELYFSRKRTNERFDIWVAQRSVLSEPWGPAVNLGPPINTSDHHEYSASITADGLELFFTREGTGDPDIWTAKRATRDESWGEPVNLGPIVNTSVSDCLPCISADGLVLCFSSHPAHNARPDGFGGPDIWLTTRPTRDAPWGTPRNPGLPINTANPDCLPCISADGHWLYYSDFRWGSPQDVRPGGYGDDDLWKAPIIPIVDLNCDGTVDSADMCIIVDYWGTDNSSCDIGPMPWGDGIVDIEDLKILAEHLFEEVNLIAHWKLDETEGPIAYDSVGEKDGFLVGDPVWQPDAGMVDGALQFDGVDDYVSTDFVLNPADGSFSVFAWIKGDASGKVVVSQQSIADWLAVDSEGNLMTELKCTGRSAGPLYSETVITDGLWHRIGLVWDGSTRTLCVDGFKVAEDTQPGLESSENSLYIGVGMDYAAGTFFSGLIDDIRIYNQALTAEEIATLAR